MSGSALLPMFARPATSQLVHEISIEAVILIGVSPVAGIASLAFEKGGSFFVWRVFHRLTSYTKERPRKIVQPTQRGAWVTVAGAAGPTEPREGDSSSWLKSAFATLGRCQRLGHAQGEQTKSLCVPPATSPTPADWTLLLRGLPAGRS